MTVNFGIMLSFLYLCEMQLVVFLTFEFLTQFVCNSHLVPIMAWPRMGMSTNVPGELQRRILDGTMTAPFVYWVAIADPKASNASKLEASKKLFAADERTLDSASIRLRRKVGSAETLLLPEYQRFMFHAVNKIVVSNAFIECLFGQFKQWQAKSPKPMGVPLVAAKHFSHQFKAGSERKRQREAGQPPSGIKRRRCVAGRPSWVFKRGEFGRKDARHVWIGKEVMSRPLGTSGTDALAVAVVDWRSPKNKKKYTDIHITYIYIYI